MSYIEYPYAFDARGRTATAPTSDHIRDLIEQVLFTNPGERVNRPDFGSGLLQLVFAPQSEELLTATRFLVQGALQQSLGHLVDVESVEFDAPAHDGVLSITVRYVIRLNQQPNVAVLRPPVA